MKQLNKNESNIEDNKSSVKQTIQSLKYLNQNPTYTSKLLFFVSLFPQINDAVILITPKSQSYDMNNFLKMYQPIQQNKMSKWFGMHISVISNQHEKTFLIVLNDQYFNFVDKQSIGSDKHLIFIYLLRKIKKIKFMFCINYSIAIQTRYDTMKYLFQIVTSILPSQKQTYKSCFGILIQDNRDKQQKNFQQVKKTLMQHLLRSVNDKIYQKKSQQTVQTIIKQLDKKKGRILVIKKNIQQKDRQQIKGRFQKEVLKQISAFETQQTKEQKQKKKSRFNIQFLYKLQQKFSKLSINGQNEKKVSFRLGKINSIWGDKFKLIMISLNECLQKKHKIDFTQIECFNNVFQAQKRPQNFLSSYYREKKKITKQQVKSNSLAFVKITCRLLQLITQGKDQYQDKYQYQSHSRKFHFFKDLLEKFLAIFYDEGILNFNINQRVLFDYFKVSFQVIEIFFSYRSKNFQNYFQTAQVFKDIIFGQRIFISLFTTIINITNHLILVDLSLIRKNQYIDVKQIGEYVGKIKEKFEKLNRIQVFKGKFPIDRMQRTLAQLHRIKTNIQLKQMGHAAPLKRINFLLQIFKLDKNTINKLYIHDLSRTFQSITQQYKIQDSYKSQLIYVRLLRLDILKNKNKIQSCFKSIYQKILRAGFLDKNQQAKNSQQALIRQYINFLLEMGLKQKAIQMSYQISHISKQLSKSCLYQCALINQNTISHVKLLNSLQQTDDNDLNNLTEHQTKQLQTIIGEIDRILKGQQAKLRSKAREEQELLKYNFQF